MVRRVVTSACGVLSQFGGIPLAFAFIASFGTLGVVTVWLNDIGFHLYEHGFTLFNARGVESRLHVLPDPVDDDPRDRSGCRRAAGANGARLRRVLGADHWQFWRHVGVPILMPALLSGDDPALR